MFTWLTDSDASYKWGQVALCVVVLIFTCIALFGCDSEAAIRQKQLEAQQRIANACVPEIGEEIVLRWTIGAEGHYVLYRTVRQPIGQRGRNVQMVIISEDEL